MKWLCSDGSLHVNLRAQAIELMAHCISKFMKWFSWLLPYVFTHSLARHNPQQLFTTDLPGSGTLTFKKKNGGVGGIPSDK
jgi:hypothetical protein